MWKISIFSLNTYLFNHGLHIQVALNFMMKIIVLKYVLAASMMATYVPALKQDRSLKTIIFYFYILFGLDH